MSEKTYDINRGRGQGHPGRFGFATKEPNAGHVHLETPEPLVHRPFELVDSIPEGPGIHPDDEVVAEAWRLAHPAGARSEDQDGDPGLDPASSPD